MKIYQRARSKLTIEPVRNQNFFEQNTLFGCVLKIFFIDIDMSVSRHVLRINAPIIITTY